MVAKARFARIASLGCAVFAVIGAVVACEDSTTPVAIAPDLDSGIGLAPSPDASALDGAVAPVSDASAEASADADASPVLVADLAADYSKTSNPSGAWTYGYVRGAPGADAGELVVFSTATEGGSGVTAWLDPTNAVLNAPSIFLNDSSASINGVAPGEAALHPGQAGEYAIARWTAPAAGTYSVEVQFKEGDIGDTNGLLVHNGAVLVTEDSTATNALHTLSVVMSAGDTLDVAVGNKGDFLYDTTPVIFKIRTSP